MACGNREDNKPMYKQVVRGNKLPREAMQNLSSDVFKTQFLPTLHDCRAESACVGGWTRELLLT